LPSNPPPKGGGPINHWLSYAAESRSPEGAAGLLTEAELPGLAATSLLAGVKNPVPGVLLTALSPKHIGIVELLVTQVLVPGVDTLDVLATVLA
jgi:hypothetical protein